MSSSGKLELRTYIYHHAYVCALVSLEQFWFMHCLASISYDPIWLPGEQRIGKREHKRKVCAFEMSLGVVFMKVFIIEFINTSKSLWKRTTCFVFCGAIIFRRYVE